MSVGVGWALERKKLWAFRISLLSSEVRAACEDSTRQPAATARSAAKLRDSIVASEDVVLNLASFSLVLNLYFCSLYLQPREISPFILFASIWDRTLASKSFAANRGTEKGHLCKFELSV